MSNDPQNPDSLGEKLKLTFDSHNSDTNYNLLKAGIGSIPSVGSLILGLAESYIASPATILRTVFGKEHKKVELNVSQAWS